MSLRLLRSEIVGFSQVAKKQDGLVEGNALVARSLHRVGRAWVEAQSPLSTAPACQPQEVADVLTIVLKTLELPSHVVVSREHVRVSTFRCPFLEEARRTGEPVTMVCERTCGEIKSLFKGLSEGFPSFTQYRAPKMMGRGHDTCVKEFHMVGIASHRRHPPSHRIRDRKTSPKRKSLIVI